MPRAVLLGLALIALVGSPAAQNSTRKLRAPVGEHAAQAGMTVRWRKDVDAALLEAKRSGKPVFWYVPAIARSPMDRKPEIDRYVMGGPFSWPTTVALLEEHFVPVKQVAGGDDRAERLGLARGVFIEPGYVVLGADGEARLQVDQLTTFHPRWFEAPLRRLLGLPARADDAPDASCADGWRALAAGDFERAERLARSPGADSDEPVPAGQLWLRGVALWRLGRSDDARECWRELAARDDEPFAAKAALELEGHGPFTRGFEVYCELPDGVTGVDPEDGSRAPAGSFTEEALWQRGVAFLSTAHEQDGVFRDSTYDFGGTDGLPNVHAAVTCLCGEALLAALARAEQGRFELSSNAVARAEVLLAMMRDNAVHSDWLALSDSDEILWARAYALRFLQAYRARRQDQGEVVTDGIRRSVAALLALQPDTGVWFHEYGNPFAIATALQALHGVQQAGFEVPADNIERGLRALLVNRTEDGAFSYSQTRPGRKPRTNLQGAAGRMPLCELALYLHGESDQQRLQAAVDAGARHHDLLAAVRKYDDHASRLGYGGFFFWFDMLGRAEAIAALDDAESRRRHAGRMRELVLALPEFDGAFVDSHELGRCYGTAMALLCLDVLARADG